MPVVAIFNGKAPASWIILGAKHSYCKSRFTHVLKLDLSILSELQIFFGLNIPTLNLDLTSTQGPQLMLYLCVV